MNATTAHIRIAVLLLAFAAAAAHAEDIRIAETHGVLLEQPAATSSHQLQLALHIFRGGRWKVEDLVPAVRGAAILIGQCRVALVHADIHVVEAPRRYHFYSTPVSRELLGRMQAPRPAVFFVDDTHNRPAYEAEAIGRGNAVGRLELADTVWIAHGARNLPQALAHELVHVLTDSGDHSREPGNLMRPETSPQNIQLTEQQCARLRARGEAHGLLTPVAPAAK
jgi:hypothetical protein